MGLGFLWGALTAAFVLRNSSGLGPLALFNCLSRHYIESTPSPYPPGHPPTDTLIAMDFSFQSSDNQPLPDRSLRPPLKTHSPAMFLQQLTLSDTIIPWSIFTGILPLNSLNLENISIEDRSVQELPLVPTSTLRTGIRHFRFRNCTDIVRKLVLVSPCHALSFGSLVSLECDMGSVESMNYSTFLMVGSHQSLETLGLDYRENDDEVAENLEGE